MYAVEFGSRFVINLHKTTLVQLFNNIDIQYLILIQDLSKIQRFYVIGRLQEDHIL